MRSTQNVQTLRLERLGLPSLRSDTGMFGLYSSRFSSEGDVVRVDVADPDARVVGQGRQLVAGHAGAGAGAARLQELDVVGDHLGGAPLLAVLALPGAGLQPPLDVDERALPRVLRHDLG